MDIIKKYVKLQENPERRNNFIKIYVYYDLGGYNYFTHREKPRGYYITVVPVTRDGVCESFTAFTGCTELLTPCARKGKKAEADALQKAPVYEKMMVDAICKKYGYILEA